MRGEREWRLTQGFAGVAPRRCWGRRRREKDDGALHAIAALRFLLDAVLGGHPVAGVRGVALIAGAVAAVLGERAVPVAVRWGCWQCGEARLQRSKLQFMVTKWSEFGRRPLWHSQEEQLG